MRAARLRERLVERMLASGVLRSDDVVSAFLTVPRDVFLPGRELAVVYADDAIVTKRDAAGAPTSSSSQPSMMAIMLEQLRVARGQHVLEIGTGTGYNTALLADLVGEDGIVVSVDIDTELVRLARARLSDLGYHNVRLAAGDGSDVSAISVPDAIPYDRVIATVGVPEIAPSWLDNLAERGRVVAPLDLRGPQCSVAFCREEAAGELHLTSDSVADCGFMRMRGPSAGAREVCELGEGRSLWLPGDRDCDSVDGAGIAAALDTATMSGSRSVSGASIAAAERDLHRGLGLWLSTREPRIALYVASGAGPVRGFAGMSADGVSGVPAIVDGDSIAMLVRVGPRRLASRGFGSRADELAGLLSDHVRAWVAAAKPASDRLRIEAYRAGVAVPFEHVIDKPSTRLAVTWW